MSMKNDKVAIFGIGPSGLMAAHAVERLGLWPVLFSINREPSILHGCQYLHSEPPGLLLDEQVVEYDLRGTWEEYRDKVYGADWTGLVSPQTVPPREMVWNLRQAYRKLFDRHVSGDDPTDFYHFKVTPENLMATIKGIQADHSMIISTVPAKALCLYPGRHNFQTQDIYAIGDRVDGNPGFSPLVEGRDGIVICDATEDVSWYRTSRVFGMGTTEWSATLRRKPPIEGVVKVAKPLTTDCDCFPDIQRLGRYGSWRKGILVSDVFEQARIYVNNMRGNAISTKRKDWCYRCGRIAQQERYVIEKRAVEYVCAKQHHWDFPVYKREA